MSVISEIITYSANEREYESSTNTCPEVTYWQNEASRNAFQCRVMRQRQVCLSHADWQLIIALQYDNSGLTK